MISVNVLSIDIYDSEGLDYIKIKNEDKSKIIFEYSSGLIEIYKGERYYLNFYCDSIDFSVFKPILKYIHKMRFLSKYITAVDNINIVENYLNIKMVSIFSKMENSVYIQILGALSKLEIVTLTVDYLPVSINDFQFSTLKTLILDFNSEFKLKVQYLKIFSFSKLEYLRITNIHLLTVGELETFVTKIMSAEILRTLELRFVEPIKPFKIFGLFHMKSLIKIVLSSSSIDFKSYAELIQEKSPTNIRIIGVKSIEMDRQIIHCLEQFHTFKLVVREEVMEDEFVGYLRDFSERYSKYIDNYLRFLNEISRNIHEDEEFNDDETNGDETGEKSLKELLKIQKIMEVKPLYLDSSNSNHILFANHFNLPVNELIFNNHLNFPDIQAIQIWFGKYLAGDIPTPHSLNSNFI